MGLFKKKNRTREENEGYIPQPLLGDSSGSPHYAKSAAYMGNTDSGAAQPWDAPGNRQQEDSLEDPPEGPGNEEHPA